MRQSYTRQENRLLKIIGKKLGGDKEVGRYL
jgi:hypothetical protein